MNSIKSRFRGFLPIVVDIETGGLNPKTDSILEISIVFLKFRKNEIYIHDVDHYHIKPACNTNVFKKALYYNKILPNHPFRLAVEEKVALDSIYSRVFDIIKHEKCIKAILVGHNAWFDLSFLIAASKRTKIKNIPFHNFSSIDTATLSILSYGQTVLSQALNAAKIKFDNSKAHSALYDSIKTAQLFCKIVNKF